jgi:hypothetical protein
VSTKAWQAASCTQSMVRARLVWQQTPSDLLLRGETGKALSNHIHVARAIVVISHVPVTLHAELCHHACPPLGRLVLQISVGGGHSQPLPAL